MEIIVKVSARHVHLNQNDFQALFGPEERLEKDFLLGQADEFASTKRVRILGANGRYLEARIIGPFRQASQVEVSLSDASYLGLKPDLRQSGDLAGSASVTLQGTVASLKLKQGLIVSARHCHLDPGTAAELGISDGQELSVFVPGPRSLTLHGVKARVKEGYQPAVHLDTDEGNAAGIDKEIQGRLAID